MCPSTEPEQKTTPSAPSAAPLFWGRLLGSDPLSWVVVQTEDLLQESSIPGRRVGKLTLLLYPITLPGCM